jgi:hypothetical protein
MTVGNKLDLTDSISLDGSCIVLVDAWEQCQDADVLLESPSAMAGVHIAEALSACAPHI